MSRCLCGVVQKIDPRMGQPSPHPPNLVIKVWNCRAVLSVCNGTEIVPAKKQPPHKMLRRAIDMAGGAINLSGYYPVSLKIWRWAERNGVL